MLSFVLFCPYNESQCDLMFILQNIFNCALQKKVIHTGLEFVTELTERHEGE